MGFVFVVHDGDGMAHMGRPVAPYLSLGSHLGRLIGSGSPSVSPRWRFCGHGSKLGSNEKVEMTLSASEYIGQGPQGLICVFSPGSI